MCDFDLKIYYIHIYVQGVPNLAEKRKAGYRTCWEQQIYDFDYNRVPQKKKTSDGQLDMLPISNIEAEI